jgi:integrase
VTWLEHAPSGNYKVVFRIGSHRFKKSLKTKDRRRAETLAGRVEENLRLVESGRLVIPDTADVPAFLLSDGKLNAKPNFSKPVTLSALFSDFGKDLPDDSLEPETMRVAQIHMRHIKAVLGPKLRVDGLTQADLQKYVNARSKHKGKRGKPLSSVTIKKELSTFSSVWSWASGRGKVNGPFPNTNLRFPRTTEKPSFQTWGEIERAITLGASDNTAQAELWDSLFLSLEEITGLLQFIGETSTYQFLHPMAVMAAHTGARRSELVRSRVPDFDLDSETVLIREKKRIRGRRTCRRVPLSPALKLVMEDWLAQKRESIYTFPRELKVQRSRKPRIDEDAVSVDEASHHLAQTLTGSKWSNIRGWHVFRHSFISNCAAKGIDQRIIDRWSGHQTEEMRRRYTHLFPDAQQQAIITVFGTLP